MDTKLNTCTHERGMVYLHSGHCEDTYECVDCHEEVSVPQDCLGGR